MHFHNALPALMVAHEGHLLSPEKRQLLACPQSPNGHVLTKMGGRLLYAIDARSSLRQISAIGKCRTLALGLLHCARTQRPISTKCGEAPVAPNIGVSIVKR